MTCEELRAVLLECDSFDTLRRDAGEHGEHLAGCERCRQFAQRLADVEMAWRETPTPEGCDAARDAFLKNLGQPAPARRPWGFVPPLRWSLAASVLVAVLLGTWLASSTSEAAAADLLDTLVEWNLALAEPGLPNREEQASRVDHLRAEVTRVSWSEDDRALAEDLLAHGVWLARNQDPLAAADHFESLAEVARQRLAGALKQGRSRDADRWARRYGSLDERGVKLNMERGKKKGLHHQQGPRWEQLQRRQNGRRHAMQQTLEQSPEASRQELRRALGLPTKKGHRTGKGG